MSKRAEERGLSSRDLSVLKDILREKEEELRRSRVVYLKPWPQKEAAVGRLQEWVEKELYRRGEEKQ